MEPTASLSCREVLDRLRAQINGHLPPIVSRDRLGNPISESSVPLDRLPMIGQVAQQYIEAEAVYASATQQSDQPASNGESGNSE